ncbi:hypothetical protein H310_11369 [Aphanomyces invadans]|uniref:Peptidase M3A/M3B catalytic domain-containing protein n=1 Tax=Aphanomyces invadans TaxID=157072 RepID=A0A024TN75_9STRA|nr:hypothetical protein H310_11369 [Aphanomyces invadans]ETV95086.1 hypothetical protein H310_11369 [Aphanomyces invadans]|eukprot:XP_008876259.1 hypothetical protein H310_11369 [Aphanomyces invadans]
MFDAQTHKAAVPPHDNTPIMEEMLRLRHELAQLLGYNSYAEVSLLDKTAPSVSAVEALIFDLRDKCLAISKVEMAEVADFALKHGQEEPLEEFDIAYWTQQLRQARYNFDGEQLKPYFPMTKVLSGLFDFVLELFGIRVEPADGVQETWHPDVQFFQMRAVEAPGEPVIAQFFMDPYARPGDKRHGCWNEVVVSRSKVLRTELASVRLPVFALMNTLTPPVDDKPVLMSHREVELLLHNFGYGLRAALSSADYTAASQPYGIEWDAVEIPSMFLRMFCTSRRKRHLVLISFQCPP